MSNLTIKLSADLLCPITSAPLEGGVLTVDTKGKVLDVQDSRYRSASDVRTVNGWLVPGLVNTHCHLELSHMKGRVDTGTGLIPFIKAVVTQRNLPEKVIAAAIRRANREMYNNGIVAVGDISNKTDTFKVKQESQISYYTFVELFDFLQEDGAEKAFADWKPVFDQAPQQDGNKASLVPHAPYSVSKNLFALIRAANPDSGITVSIHNQETPDEEALFQNKGGGFPAFYQSFGNSLTKWKPTGQSAIHYALQHLNPNNRTLFVHNTLTSAADISAAHAWSNQVYWATCANANLYIENRLPDYRHFMAAGARMTIGTDSLTSNWQLSILEEMKTIQRFQSYVPTEMLLTWATIYGAQALGMDDKLGSFDAGKQPGVVLISGMNSDRTIGKSARARRVI